MERQTRRDFLKTTGAAAAAAGLGQFGACGPVVNAAEREYDISLAGWSLHRTIGEEADKTPQLDMPKLARNEFDIGAIELVNQMMPSSDAAYVKKLGKHAADNDVDIILIMVDREGSAGAADREERIDAVRRHSRWIDIAADLGCHTIRMNWAGAPENVMDNEEVLDDFINRSVRAFSILCDHGDEKNINITIENHGGPSSHVGALERLIKKVDHERFGTLPDFGNFPRDESGKHSVDIYDSVSRMMPYAKAVSAKCYDFDDAGNETTLDFDRLIKIVVDEHDYHGHIGIEYEGNRLSEFDGIKACKKLLERLRG